MQTNSKNESEINIIELINILLNKFWIILLAAVLGTIGVGVFSKLIMKPVYTSSTKLYIIHRQNKETTTYSDLQTGTQLTMDYKILVLSRPVTEQVIRNLKLNLTHEELVSGITVDAPADTRILEIRVENTDPILAKKIADSIADISADRMVLIMGIEKVNIVEPGNIPTIPSKPNVKLNMLAGCIISGLLVYLILVIRYLFDDSIKSSDDIEQHLAITTLGTIPFVGDKKSSKSNPIFKRIFRKKSKSKKQEDPNINIEDDSRSFEKDPFEFISLEAYKVLRTNILFCGKEVKTICITSSIPNEGKTVVSFRLASTIAASGKKVLFIDADLRKSVIIGRLKINREVIGLSQYLSGMNDLEDIIHETKVKNLDIIFTGPLPPNPSEMLGSDAFKELIRTQREEYDYIIIDTPPLGVVIDSANVAKICDGTIIVIESYNVSYKIIQRILRQLEQGDCRILGAILNKAEINHSDYKKYYGSNYYGTE